MDDAVARGIAITREQARRDIARKLMFYLFLIVVISLIVGGTLVFYDKINSETFINLIVIISAIFSGLVASAVTFYYSQHSS
ncbi:MAG: hypothetical protein WC613_05910 [Candidatus Aenigmatarchaeota archaeon]